MKFKRILSAVLAAVLAVVLCFGGYLLYRFNCDKSNAVSSYEEVYSQPQAVLDVDESGVFTILKINDTHFFNGTSDSDLQTLSELEIILSNAEYGLIIVDGDLVEGFNLSTSYDKFGAISKFAALIEKYNTPWTFAPGNNDGEIDGNNESLIAYMLQYNHFICGNSKDIDGAVQFFIDLAYDNEIVHSIAVMDSGMRNPKAIGSYEHIKENQINWLLNGINERKVKTSVFFHMPTPAFQSAYDNGEPYGGFTMYNAYSYNDIPKNELFDNMTADNEYISLISCAHQHSNNMCSFYNGRYYQLSSVSGYSASHQDFIIPSYTLTAINVLEDDTKSMYTFNQVTENDWRE